MKLTQVRYAQIYRKLNAPEDLDALSKSEGIPREVLTSILAHKIVRQTIRLFYKVKARSKELYSHWKRGKSFLEISRICRIAPTLCASFILAECGFSKKAFRKAVLNPSEIKDERLRKELAEAIREDFIYSDWAAAEQRERGMQHEKKLEKWLTDHGCSFWTEKERTGEEKTPDCLLKKSIRFKGKTVHWFESKGYFGDAAEMRRNYNKQFKHYVNLFGPGVVVYWLGFVVDAKLPPDFRKNIILVDGSDLK